MFLTYKLIVELAMMKVQYYDEASCSTPYSMMLEVC